MSKGKRIWTGLAGLAAAMLLWGMPLPAQAAEQPQGMKEVAGNGQLTLYLNEEDASVAVMDNATGKWWYTNPPGAESDGIATPYYKELMKSQLQIQYFNENVQSATMDINGG